MKYTDFRSQIKSGDVLLWTHTGVKSWKDFELLLVRITQRSEYTHAGLALVFAGRVFVLEAVGTGVRIFPLSRELPFFHIGTNVEWTQEAEEFALATVGQKYSKWEAIMGIFGETKRDDNWQCAEYVRETLKLSGLNLDCIATPSAIVNSLLDRGFYLQKVD